MAICRKCHRLIPEGKEYCDNCLQAAEFSTDESYLDRLLGSVMTGPPVKREHRIKARTFDDIADKASAPAANGRSSDDYDIMSEDDFFGNLFDDAEKDAPDYSEKNDNEDVYSAIDSFSDLSLLQEDNEVLSEPDIENKPENAETLLDEFDLLAETDGPEISDDNLLKAEDTAPDNDTVPESVQEKAAPPELSEYSFDTESPPEPFELDSVPEARPDSYSEASQAEEPIADLSDIGFEGDEISADSGEEIPYDDLSDIPELSADEISDESGYFDYLNNLGIDDSTFMDDDEIRKINEIESQVDIDRVMDEIESGDLDREISKLVPEENQGKKNKKKQKKGFFQRIFGNVKEDLTDEERKARKEKLEAEAEEKLLLQKDKERLKAASKEERKLLKQQAAEDKKAADAIAKQTKEEKAKTKKDQAAAKAKEKESKKLAMIEIDEDPGRINRVGATILLVFFTAFVIFIVYGTDLYSYNVSIENAETNFDRQRYNEAYHDVYGLDIKDKDIAIYDKIMTVMFVNKQLNSYNNYYAIGMPAEALDSLLKGLMRYDKYMKLATELGIRSDFDFIRNNIIVELANVYHISEATAQSIIAINGQTEYSERIFEITDNLT